MKVCVLDENEKRPIPPFFQTSLKQLGHEVITVYSQSTQDANNKIRRFKPELILSIQNVGLMASEILCCEELSPVKKAIFFYDDPVGSLWLFGKQHPLLKDPKRYNVHFFIWDHHWKKEMQQQLGVPCFSTHLSAETEYFSPGKKDLIPDIQHCVVFLGNLPSHNLLKEVFETLPSSHKKIARAVENEFRNGPYGLNPFDALQREIRRAAEDDRANFSNAFIAYMNSVPDLNKPFAPHIQLRRYAWLTGKRETRLRALRIVARIAPLAILSNSKTPDNMGKDEFEAELKKNSSQLCFVDTSQANYYQLGHLYASGLVHFQSTDPQSVSGGIPYRVFQSAACGVPLISDTKPELAESFKADEEMLFYKDENNLGSIVESSLRDPKSLREIGSAAYKRFCQDHTWLHRVENMLTDLSLATS